MPIFLLFKGMKFAIAIYGYSAKPDDHGVAREWYAHGEGSAVRWTPVFVGARQMDLATALDVYKRLDDPQRKLGLIPIE